MRTPEIRGRLQHNIWMYKRRGVTERTAETIKKWEKMIEDIDKDTIMIRAIANCVAYRTGYNVKESYHSRLPGMREALGLYYKYGLDNGLLGKRLLEYTGATNSSVPGNYRSWMVSSEENREVYRGFKEYMNELLQNIEK